MISLSDVSFSHGARTLLRGVSLQVPPGRRLAIVGSNGVGKTTLLELIVGLREPDGGAVTRPRDLTVGYLPQDPATEPGATVLAAVLAGARRVVDVEAQLRRLEVELARAGDDPALLERYARLQDRFEQLGGFAVEAEARRVLAGLGFAPEDGERGVDELSGGWRMRVALARLLIDAPDVLVLDEPTNHLDIDSIEWLERTLAAWPGAIVFVSHDRDFIDALADRVVEVAATTATEYAVSAGPDHGAFDDFVARRDARLDGLRAARKQQDRELAQAERFIERFRYKKTKARQVQSRIKAVARVERVEVPDVRETRARFGFPEPPRAGRVVAELAGVTKRYPLPDGRGDRTVLDRVDVAVERGWKVAIVGPNGAGKTTLSRLLAGDLTPDAGTVTHGHNVTAALSTQHQVDALDLDRTVLEELRSDLGERHRGVNHRTMLGAFGFSGTAADQVVRSLSGGEQARLALAKLMVAPVNLLCLDEPTNHLDIPSRDVLEDALVAYPGTIVLVTHDRHVIRAVVDHVVEVRDGGVTLHPGGYDDWLWHRQRRQAEVAGADRRSSGRACGGQRSQRDGAAAARRDDDKRLAAERRNVAYRRTRGPRAAVERVETQLERSEAEVAELTRQLAQPGVYDDGEQVKQLVARHGAAKDRAASLMAEWEEAQLALERAQDEVAATRLR